MNNTVQLTVQPFLTSSTEKYCHSGKAERKKQRRSNEACCFVGQIGCGSLKASLMRSICLLLLFVGMAMKSHRGEEDTC